MAPWSPKKGIRGTPTPPGRGRRAGWLAPPPSPPAAEHVRQRVEPHTWEAFRLTAFEERSGADTATHLGLKVATVFKAKSKVQKMLQEEIARLEGS